MNSTDPPPLKMSSFIISKDLVKTSEMSDYRHFELSGNESTIEGDLLCFISVKRWWGKRSGKKASRHFALSRSGFLLIWISPTKGFVLRLRKAEKVSVLTENVSGSGGDKLHCTIKVFFPFGMVNLLISGDAEKIRGWREGITAAFENRLSTTTTNGADEERETPQTPCLSSDSSREESSEEQPEPLPEAIPDSAILSSPSTTPPSPVQPQPLPGAVPDSPILSSPATTQPSPVPDLTPAPSGSAKTACEKSGASEVLSLSSTVMRLIAARSAAVSDRAKYNEIDIEIRKNLASLRSVTEELAKQKECRQKRPPSTFVHDSSNETSF